VVTAASILLLCSVSIHVDEHTPHNVHPAAVAKAAAVANLPLPPHGCRYHHTSACYRRTADIMRVIDLQLALHWALQRLQTDRALGQCSIHHDILIKACQKELTF
jgi:hypothetical protein